MTNRYADFYAAWPAMTERTLRTQYAILAENHSADWFLGAVSRPSEPVVMAFVQVHVASLEYPMPRFEGNFIGLMDEIGDFGANLGAIDGLFFEDLVLRDVPSTAAVTAALAATTLGHQLAVAADDDASRVSICFSVLVPPPFMPQILRQLARGPFRPRALWSIVEHIVARPSLLAVCGPFVDWCRVAVAMGVGTDNPLHAIDGYPQTVAHDEALGCARVAIRDLDFPPAAGPAPPTAPGIAASALQPLVDAMVALGDASREREAAKEDLRYAEAQEKVAPSTVWESGIGSLWLMCQATDDTELPPHLGPVGQSRQQACPSRLGRSGQRTPGHTVVFATHRGTPGHQPRTGSCRGHPPVWRRA
jgi:hypothetical protein